MSRQAGCFCDPNAGYKIESVLSVDENGQVALPKDVREKAGIGTGAQLALISCTLEETVCCLALMKVENLNGIVGRM